MLLELTLVTLILATPEPTVDRVAQVAELSWLAGCWHHEEAGRVSEECWMAPRAGMMLGLHRDVRAGRPFFEYLRIADHDGGVAYLASPRGREPTAFRLIENGAQRAVFANPEHDFPQRIIYWLSDDDRLHARIEGEVDGEARSSEWSWARAPGFVD